MSAKRRAMATQAAQSATENMVKMGTDFWQNVMNSQQWNQNGSNPAAAWSKMFSQASGGNPFTQGSNPFAHIPWRGGSHRARPSASAVTPSATRSAPPATPSRR